MSQVKNLKIGNTTYGITDANTLPALTSAQRTTLLSNGTYLGKSVETNKVFETTSGTFENFTDTVNPPTLTWNSTTSTASCSRVAYANNKFLGFASNYNALYESTDGLTWTATGAVLPFGYWSDLKYGLGKFVAFYNAETGITFSTDGSTWSYLASPWSINSIIVSDDKVVIFRDYSGGTNNFAYTTDFVNWSETMPAATMGYWTLGDYHNGLYLVSREDTTDFMYSTDGISWTAGTFPLTNAYPYKLVYGNNMWILCAKNPYSSTDKYLTSSDGINWTERELPSSATYWTGAYGDGVFIIRNQTNTTAYYSTDGINWSETTMPAVDAFAGIIYGANKFIDYGSTTFNYCSFEATHTYALTDLNATMLKNTATGTNSMSVGGTSSTSIRTLNIGIGSNANTVGAGTLAIGCNSVVSGSGSIGVGMSSNVVGTSSVGVGCKATVPVNGSILLGCGTNDEPLTFKVALNDTTTPATDEDTGLYTLLKDDGKIPADRLSDSVIIEAQDPTGGTPASYVGQLCVNQTNQNVFAMTGLTPVQNYNITGSPTITNMVMTNSTASDYISYDTSVSGDLTSLEINASYIQKSMTASTVLILGFLDDTAVDGTNYNDSSFPIALCNEAGMFDLYVGSHVYWASTTTTSDQHYLLKVTWDNTTKLLKLLSSTDGGSTWSELISQSIESITLSSNAMLKVRGRTSGNDEFILPNFEVKVNDVSLWTPYTDENLWTNLTGGGSGTTYYAGSNINFSDAKIEGTLGTNTTINGSEITLTSTTDTGLVLPSSVTSLNNKDVSTYTFHIKADVLAYSGYSSTQRMISMFGGNLFVANGQSGLGSYGSSNPQFTTAGTVYIKIEKTSTATTIYTSTDDSTWTQALTTTNIQSTSYTGDWYLGASKTSGKTSYTNMKFYLDDCYLIVDGTEVWRGYDSSKSGYNINADSSLLQNTATGTNSLTILGNATSANNAINLGYNSTSTSFGGIAIGSNSRASTNAIGMGFYSYANGIGSIQLGKGTNNEAGSFQVGLTTNGSTWNNYKLLSSTGLMPVERLGGDSSATTSTKYLREDGTWQTVSGGGLPIGQIISMNCTSDYTPDGCLPCDGSEYTKTQFTELWTNYLTSSPVKLNTCSYTDYETDITTYGQCGKFAVDTTNETFKVPTIKDGSYLTQAKSDTELGKAYNESLPNITGKAYFGGANVHTDIVGAFTTYSVTTNPSGSGTTTTTGLALDASLASSVYQDDAKVQGDNIRMRFFIVVSDGQMNQASMDWSAWATSLAGRINTDASNATSTGKETIVGWGQIDYSAGVTVSTITSTNTYTAPSDGIYIMNYSDSSAVSGKVFQVNGNTAWAYQYTSAGNPRYNVHIHLSKGDVLSTDTTSVPSTVYYSIFYPCKGV